MGQTNQRPVILSVASFDPSGGAGVLADLKTFVAHDCYGVAAVTSLTARNTRETRKMMPVDPAMLRMQLQALFEDFEVAGIKIGAIGSKKNLEVVAECLESQQNVPIVADPVFLTTNGTDSLTESELGHYRRLILPRAVVLTPSAEEAGRLLGVKVSTLEEMKGAAKLLHEQGVKHVVITGEHLEKPGDVYYEGQDIEVFLSHRATANGHAISCTLSSAILANLVSGRAARESVVMAKAYVSQAIARAHPLGNGRSLLNHLFRFGEHPVRAGGPEVLHEHH